jgi:hypothetical protein
MDQAVPQNQYPQEKEYLTLEQRQRLGSIIDRIRVIVLNTTPYLTRFVNELMLILLKVVRGSIRIAKEQLLTLKG